ncbi:vWA domain-containing protein [Novipirellula artificiosorum]|uniref:von Willebrand factor n=1 Tax=Novipirellula artificiosorum TaxID=2528016 RepID=A0A5C6E674_9BACT|nr:von Willebrand factor type A domain-containing protein [Novipirellula artificiosorum]TWU42659.1 von Willebrand factor [Novipirellula artificiosorum]
MNQTPNPPSNDPELEARIVALVLGEASEAQRSDAPRDELKRLIEEHPEQAAFMREIQNVDGLLRDVAKGEAVGGEEEWKLPAEKRKIVLAEIHGELPESSHGKSAVSMPLRRRMMQRDFLRSFAKVAAVLLVAVLFGSIWFGSVAMRTAQRARSSYSLSQRKQLDDALHSELNAVAIPELSSYASMAEGAIAKHGAIVMTDGIVSKDDRDSSRGRSAMSTAESDSKSSLSGIRESLEAKSLPSPYYLQDDVQYFPAGPEFKLSREAAVLRQTRKEELQTRAGQTDVLRRSMSLRGGTDLSYSLEAAPADAPAAGRKMDVDMDIDGVEQEGVWLDHESVRADGMSAGLAGEDKVLGERLLEESVAATSRDVKGQYFSADSASMGEPPAPSAPWGGMGGGGMSGGAAMDGLSDRSKKNLDRDQYDFGLQENSPMDGESEPMATIDELSIAGKVVKGLTENKTADQPEWRVQPGQSNRGWFFGDDASREHADPVPAELEELGKDSINLNLGGIASAWDELPTQQKAELGESRQLEDHFAAIDGGMRYRFVAPELPALYGQDLFRDYKNASPQRLAAPAGLDEKTAEAEAFSTFSLHVSDVSFKLAQAALASGSWPEPGKVRIEEFVNAMDYGDPMPSESEKVACRVEQSIHPFLQQRNVLRVSMRTAAAGRASNTPLRLTLLLDNSGSMERIDRSQTVRRAFAMLAEQLKPIDQVTLISFARQPRLLADQVSGSQSNELVQLIDNLPSEGGTNIEAALQLAFEKAREQQLEGAQNRIVLLTDGAVNLGDANPDRLSQMIVTMRGAGIAFDAAGISAEGLNDEILEALTRKGDGRYYLLDSVASADDGFARQIAGALRPSAKNVKVQVEFNPKRVGRYKLLGFEKHLLNKEDFRDDQVDAAEMAAAEAGVALYQFEAKPDGEGDVGSVSVRFRDLSTGQMIENHWPIPYEPGAPRLDRAAPSLRIATSAALLAAKLRGEPLGETVDLKTLATLIAGLPDQDRTAPRILQLGQMIQQAREVSGK